MPERSPAPAASGLHDPGVRDAADPGAELRGSPCPVCGHPAARPRFEVEGFPSRVVVCAGCGVGRFDPMPDAGQVRSFYPAGYYGEPGAKFQPVIERMVRLVGERHLGFLSGGLARGARVLDVGCGRGVILGALADRGFEVHGVELSVDAARGADPRAEIRIAGRLEDAGYPDGFFDQVVIWHVFEHLADPLGTLATVRRILRPGGRLIVALPNFASLQARWTGSAWFHLDLPRHLYHYPLAALRQLLARSGFEIESEHHFSLRQNPFGWVQSLLNRCPALPRNALYTLLHQRPPGEPAPYPAPVRAALWTCFALGAPLGLALTLLETALRSGATVHLVARRSGPG